MGKTLQRKKGSQFYFKISENKHRNSFGEKKDDLKILAKEFVTVSIAEAYLSAYEDTRRLFGITLVLGNS